MKPGNVDGLPGTVPLSGERNTTRRARKRSRTPAVRHESTFKAAKNPFARAERVPIADEVHNRSVPTLNTEVTNPWAAALSGVELWDAVIVGGGPAGLSAARSEERRVG